MTEGISLMGFGCALWLMGYYLPARVVDWSNKPSWVRSGRNRVGEKIARVLGPLLIIGGFVFAIASA